MPAPLTLQSRIPSRTGPRLSPSWQPASRRASMTPVSMSTRWKYCRDSLSSKLMVFRVFSSQGALTKYTPSCSWMSTWPRCSSSMGCRTGASASYRRMGGSLESSSSTLFSRGSTPSRMGAIRGEEGVPLALHKGLEVRDLLLGGQIALVARHQHGPLGQVGV